MKTLLTILSTLSLASPIISVSAGVFSDVNSISATDEQKKDSIPDLADVDGDGTATNIANPVKMLKTDLDPDSSLKLMPVMIFTCIQQKTIQSIVNFVTTNTLMLRVIH
jgi:hypothetical protein